MKTDATQSQSKPKVARRAYPALIADLEFSLELPVEFVEPEFPREDVDFADPTKMAPLMLASSPVATALITVSARPAYDDGCVEQWTRFLADHFGMTLTSVEAGRVGDASGSHPAVLCRAEQVQDGTALTFFLATIEDGKRLLIVNGMCPTELLPSYGAALESGVRSMKLARPHGGTVPLMLEFRPGTPG